MRRRDVLKHLGAAGALTMLCGTRAFTRQKVNKLTWYYDIAHAAFPWPMAAMMKFMPHDHIFFGTDYSAEPIESTVNEIPNLGLTDEFMQNMGRRNAEKLFPKLKV